VVAADRRGHGRSTQVGDGHDMDHYADDLAAVVEHLDLHDTVHIGHSTGGGEVCAISPGTVNPCCERRFAQFGAPADGTD
jgi:pimeloyl-ACP methyl ester carboxylesterase